MERYFEAVKASSPQGACSWCGGPLSGCLPQVTPSWPFPLEFVLAFFGGIRRAPLTHEKLSMNLSAEIQRDAEILAQIASKISSKNYSKADSRISFLCAFSYFAKPTGQGDRESDFLPFLHSLEKLNIYFPVEVSATLAGPQDAFCRNACVLFNLCMCLIPVVWSFFSFLTKLTVIPYS